MRTGSRARTEAGPGVRLVPAEHQPPLPLEQLVRTGPSTGETLPLDVLFVGAGPAGLAGAIELARLARAGPEPLRALEIGVLEKAAALGEHSLSGAVVDPVSLRALFPALASDALPLGAPVAHERVYVLGAKRHVRIPTPPTMRNRGNHVASLCTLVRWLGARAEELGVNVLTGFAAAALLVEDTRVRGVRTVPAGLDREGRPGPGHAPAVDVTARVTVLAEGSRGALTEAWRAWQGVGAPNPQIYALGVKELWRVPRAPAAVIHTLGWPLANASFGGSFCYPMDAETVALGLVVGLDADGRDIDVHARLQELKEHPLFRALLTGGELLEWGAKTIPEGGFHSLPERLGGDGLLLAGDSAGLVDVAALKGIHYAIESGIQAGRAVHAALAAGDTSWRALAPYDAAVRDGYVGRHLWRTRNMRLAFKRGLFRGGARAGWMSLAGGRLGGARIAVPPDAAVPRTLRAGGPAEIGALHVSKVDAVFRAGNATRDDLPSHLLLPERVPPELADFYARLCPAAVYEREGDALRVQPSNCIDCKTTDVLGPRWLPREGGAGPRYRRM